MPISKFRLATAIFRQLVLDHGQRLLTVTLIILLGFLNLWIPNGQAATSNYPNNWLPLPKLVGHQPNKKTTETVSPVKGEVTVYVFIASWCVPCQVLVDQIHTLKGRLGNRPYRILYVFAHDTEEDASGFSKEHKIKDGLMASKETLKAFNNPVLPTIYVGDRDGWMTTRYVDSKPADVESLEQFIRSATHI